MRMPVDLHLRAYFLILDIKEHQVFENFGL